MGRVRDAFRRRVILGFYLTPRKFPSTMRSSCKSERQLCDWVYLSCALESSPTASAHLELTMSRVSVEKLRISTYSSFPSRSHSCSHLFGAWFTISWCDINESSPTSPSELQSFARLRIPSRIRKSCASFSQCVLQFINFLQLYG